MPSIWDLPRREDQRGSAMVEPRARMLEVLGLLGTPFPTSNELGTSALYRAGRLDAMAGGPTQGQFREGVSDKTKDLALNLFGIFKGVKGATKAEKQALLKAQQMAREGADRDTIWNATLWYKGKDGKWRTEIDDSGAKLDAIAAEQFKGTPVAMKDVVSHPSLYDTYQIDEPAFFSIDPYYKKGEGQYSHATSGLRGFDIKAPDATEGKSVALHELQHAIQQREGMARGGSPEQFTDYRGALERAKANNGFDPVTGDYDFIIRNRIAEFGDDPGLAYRRLLGEVDASNTQKRMDMTLDQRREFPPWSTWDVPEADQIVRFGDGPAMSTQWPEDFITTSFKDAGFVAPDGTLLGKVGRHRELPAMMGFPDALKKGEASGVDKWMEKFGTARITRFWDSAAASVVGKPTEAQIMQFVIAAGKNPLDLEVINPKTGKMVTWGRFDNPDSMAKDIKRFFNTLPQDDGGIQGLLGR